MLAVHHLKFILLEIVEPVLVRIGELWEQGMISEFQEHFSSHFLRDRLLSLKNMFRIPQDGPLLVTACSPGERHEMGILLLGYFALQGGYRVIHIGTAPSVKGVFDCLNRCRPAAFAFSSSCPELFHQALPFEELDREITDRGMLTKVLVGGRIFQADSRLDDLRNVFIVSGNARDAVNKIKRLAIR